MTRHVLHRLPLIAGTLLLLSGSAAAEHAPTPEPEARRSFVLLRSDDHRYDFMSFMNGAPPLAKMPSLDRMAREGVHVRNAFVTTSRASILTGRYAHRHGVVDNSTPAPADTKLFPGELQRAGYRTACIGKSHMGEANADDNRAYAFPHTSTTLALRSDRYKFIRRPGVRDRQELYDLVADPKEKRNFIDSPDHADRVEAMRERLWDRLEEGGGMSVPLRRGDLQVNGRKGRD
ncbi:MAG TPA: sulfatase-like hydrolase/transferase [Vicinamibacterales bacterium]|nr:sulfatase-like hydrolase/transferase [Vicinamibacterales bacterium]